MSAVPLSREPSDGPPTARARGADLAAGCILPVIATPAQRVKAGLNEILTEYGPPSPRKVVISEPILPTLAERRSSRPEKLAISYCLSDDESAFLSSNATCMQENINCLGMHAGSSSNIDLLSYLISPRKSRKKMTINAALAPHRPRTASGGSCTPHVAHSREPDGIKYCTSVNEEGRLAGKDTRGKFTMQGECGNSVSGPAMLRMPEAATSMPSTPQRSARPASREPSLRVRRAFLHEPDTCRGASKGAVTPRWTTDTSNQQPPPLCPHASAAASGAGGDPRQRSAGSDSSATGGSENSNGQYYGPAMSVHSLSHAGTPRRHNHAGACTPRMWSPRAFDTVSDALKERCTSALSSTLRDMPALAEKDKTQIMNSYSYEVCVALEDHQGLQFENIRERHRQESSARCHAMLAEHGRQKDILERKLAERRRAKEAAAALLAAAAKTETEVEALLGTEDESAYKGHACSCQGERMENGDCAQCFSLRFEVKNHDILRVLKASSKLLLCQAAVMPQIAHRMCARTHQSQHANSIQSTSHVLSCEGGASKSSGTMQASEHAGGSGAGGGAGRDSETARGERRVQIQRPRTAAKRPATASGERAADKALPEGWVVRTSRSTGKQFYYHTATKNTQWLPPLN